MRTSLLEEFLVCRSACTLFTLICPDEKEVEKTFWLSRPDVWVIKKKTKRIIMLEFKRASDTTETYYSDMKSITER